MQRGGWGGAWPRAAVVGLRATWQVGHTGVVTGLTPEAREEASRPRLPTFRLGQLMTGRTACH